MEHYTTSDVKGRVFLEARSPATLDISLFTFLWVLVMLVTEGSSGTCWFFLASSQGRIATASSPQ